MKLYKMMTAFKIVLSILGFYFQASVEAQRRKKGITPTLPPPEEREEMQRKMNEEKRKFREKQREIRKEYFQKIESDS